MPAAPEPHALPGVEDAGTAQHPRHAPLLVGKYHAVAPRLDDSPDEVAVERFLEIVVDGEIRGGTMHSPGELSALVTGFCFCEGIVRVPEDMAAMAFETLDEHSARCRVSLTPSARRSLRRRAAAPRESAVHPIPPGPSPHCLAVPHPEFRLTPDTLFAAMAGMEARQQLFRITGATHCAALFDAGGEILTLAEDLGRHNALDKAIGMALRGRVLDRARGAVMSSRLSCELVRKAAMAGLPVLAGVSMASTLAVQLSRRWGLTLVGRLRPPRMNVYACPHRLLPERLLLDQADASPTA